MAATVSYTLRAGSGARNRVTDRTANDEPENSPVAHVCGHVIPSQVEDMTNLWKNEWLRSVRAFIERIVVFHSLYARGENVITDLYSLSIFLTSNSPAHGPHHR